MKGEAPNSRLRKAFARFKTWLVSVYRQLKNLDAKINPEITGVMDRLLASEDEIYEAQREQSIKSIFEIMDDGKVDKKKVAAYEDLRELFNEDAKTKMERELLKQLQKERDLFLNKNRGYGTASA